MSTIESCCSEAREEVPTIEFNSARKKLLRVLVADDLRDVADSVCALAKMWGHDARAAYDGVAALDLVSSYQPDVLLLDITMPKMDGCRLAEQLRRQTGFAATLIAVTGWPDHEHRVQCEAVGFDGYLVKPVEPSALEKLLSMERDRLLEPSTKS
jgi:CheY-like chemotaxis protein